MLSVCQRLADRTFTSSDTFFALQNINLTWQGKSGLLANAQPVDLFHIAKRNGTNLSYDQFVNYCGGVLKLIPGGMLQRMFVRF